MIKIIKCIMDFLLIIAWMLIIAFKLDFSGWLVLMSILFWFSSYVEKVESGE